MKRLQEPKSRRRVRPAAAPARPARHLSGLLLVLCALLAVSAYVWLRPRLQERALRGETLDQLAARSQREPGNGRVFYYLGLRRRDQGDLPGARDAFAQAGLHGVDDEQAWLAWADAAVTLHDDQGAVSVLRTFLKTHPDSARAHKALALVYLRWGNLSGTYDEALAAARLAPRDTEAWRLAGSAAFGGPNTPKAGGVAAYREAVRNGPGDWHNVQGLGQVLAAEGRDDEALTCYRRAAALAPNAPDPAVSLAVLLLKRARTPAQRAEAEPALTRGTALAPTSALAWYSLGEAYCDDGRYAPARPALERAARLAPDQPKVHYRLWTVYQHLGNPALAAREAALHAKLEQDRLTEYKLQSNVHDHPGDVGARLALARFFASRGNYPRAAYEYQHLIARAPGLAAAQKEYEALRQKAPHTEAATGIGDGVQGALE